MLGVSFTHVLNRKRVQLFKYSFSDLTYIPRMENCHAFTAYSQVSFKTVCPVRKCVTIKATKGLEDNVSVTHVTYMIFVSQQSDSILVFLHILFTYKYTLYNIEIIEKSIE